MDWPSAKSGRKLSEVTRARISETKQRKKQEAEEELARYRERFSKPLVTIEEMVKKSGLILKDGKVHTP